MRSRLSPIAITAALLLVAAASAQADGSKLYVAANGLDSPSCGAQTKPCRSISKAIDTASGGETIVVGPGMYSEETGETGPQGVERTILDIGKDVRVVSSTGAERTIIRGRVDDSELTIVGVDAVGAQFGAKDQGFTIIGGSGQTAVNVRAAGTVISGNVSVGNGVGFRLAPTANGQILAQYNSAIGGSTGFEISAGGATVSVLASYNSASDNTIGFVIDEGNGTKVVVHNTAVRNKIGISISGGDQVLHNTIEGNTEAGIAIVCRPGPVFAPTLVDVSRNAIVGNIGPGIVVNSLCHGLAKFHENNIFANVLPPFFGPPSSSSNCGIVNNDASGGPLDATNNYWGTATGPGADPADKMCGSPTNTKPVATGPFAID